MKKRSQTLLWIGLPIVLALGAIVLGAWVLPAYAQGGAVSGKVVSPDDYPLPNGTVVKLFDPDEKTLHGQANPDLDDGDFVLGPVPNGLYVLKAVPPPASGLTQSFPRPISVVNSPVTGVRLHLTRPQITGTVTAPDGVTPTAASVTVFLGDGQVLQHVHAPDGQFNLGGLPMGGYWLQAYRGSDEPYWRSERQGLSIPDLNSQQVLTLTLTEADLWGTVADEEGVPVAFARVIAARENGAHRAALSSPSGYWTLGGLSEGTYRLTAIPPLENSGLIPPEPISATLPGAANPYTLTFGSPPKVVRGSVRTKTGLPVYHALVSAKRVNKPGQAEALTNAGGLYRLDLTPGLWALRVHPIRSTDPGNWVYSQPPQLVHFQHNNQPEQKEQHFIVLTADASVSGEVAMPGGGTPPFTVTVGLYNAEGIGRRVETDPGDGTFEAQVPHGGYKVSIHPQDPGYLGSVVEPIRVPPNGSYDLGTLMLLARDALITGTLITAEGDPVAGIPVVAWRPGVPGSLKTASGPDGMYALAVSEGLWHVQPAPGPDQPYLFLRMGEQVQVRGGQVVGAIDFHLLPADATISGVLVDGDGGSVVDADGWARAQQARNPLVHNGAPIQGGTFEIPVPSGTYQVAAHLPAGSQYMSTGERRVAVAAGETEVITLTVQQKDASIAGALWDPRNEDVVEGVAGMVGAWWGPNWTAKHINQGNGTYQLDVAGGLWHLNYRIDPAAGYAKIAGPVNVPVQSGGTAAVPLPVVPKDGAITGVVKAPDGSPLPGATVWVKGTGGEVGHLWLKTHSRTDGRFRLEVPHGRYRLGAAVSGERWIKPGERLVPVMPGGVSGDYMLQFREPDATISGTLTVTDTTDAGMVTVWAWSRDGGFTNGQFPVRQDPSGGQASGPYSLGVISGTVWHMGAVFETPSQFWMARESIPVRGDAVSQDLLLEGPFPKPAPVVITFDSQNPQRISLADGTHIFIPAGAMPVSGEVTLRVVPIASLPHQRHARVIKHGYAFLATDESGEPIEAHFNQDVLIHFSYDERDLLPLGIPDNWLKPAYFSTTTDQWTFPESYVIDTDAKQVIMYIDHFTDYALTTEPVSRVFLPALTN